MREILFRGRDKYTNEWFYGFVEAPHTTVDGVVESYYFNSYVNGKSCRKIISADTLGQYTGLTDKNGNKIFEGDIVQGAWETIFAVYYDSNYLQFRAKVKDDYTREIDYYGNSTQIEVIGNIHDKPELLKEAEQE